MTKKIVKLIMLAISFCTVIIVGMNAVYAAPESEDLEGFLQGSDSEEFNTIDDIMGGAQSFLEAGNQKFMVRQDKLKESSDFFYNILLAIALILTVVIGMIIGIKFMIASVEEKAKYKEALVPYVVGCIVVFGAFTIWKIAIEVLKYKQ